eukprot:1787576-Lingulodinium_polyedra.AAC.1
MELMSRGGEHFKGLLAADGSMRRHVGSWVPRAGWSAISADVLGNIVAATRGPVGHPLPRTAAAGEAA